MATETKKPTLEISLESLGVIEQEVDDWLLLNQHYAQFNMSKTEQLDLATRLYRRIKQEIQRNRVKSPAYSTG